MDLLHILPVCPLNDVSQVGKRWWLFFPEETEVEQTHRRQQCSSRLGSLHLFQTEEFFSHLLKKLPDVHPKPRASPRGKCRAGVTEPVSSCFWWWQIARRKHCKPERWSPSAESIPQELLLLSFTPSQRALTEWCRWPSGSTLQHNNQKPTFFIGTRYSNYTNKTKSITENPRFSTKHLWKIFTRSSVDSLRRNSCMSLHRS